MENTFLRYHEDKPCIELSAGFQPIPTTLPNKQELLVHMKVPEDHQAIKQIYQDGGVDMKSLGGNKLELTSDSWSHAVSYFYRWFHELTTMDGTPMEKPEGREAQLEWIKEHRGLRIEEEVMRSGLLSVSTSSMEVGKVENPAVLGDVISGNVVLFIRTYNIETQSIVRVYLTIGHREVVEMDNVKWTKATSTSEMDAEEGGWKRKENYNIIGDLGRSVIESVDGYLLEGVPCTKENRNDWIKKIPYHVLYAATTVIFRGTQVKNA